MKLSSAIPITLCGLATASAYNYERYRRNRCQPEERDRCCGQSSDKSHGERESYYKEVGCNIKKCDKHESCLEARLRTTAFGASDLLAGASLSLANGRLSDAVDRCCNQSSNKSYSERESYWGDVGCNIEKCNKRNDGDWNGDTHDDDDDK